MTRSWSAVLGAVTLLASCSGDDSQYFDDGPPGAAGAGEGGAGEAGAAGEGAGAAGEAQGGAGGQIEAGAGGAKQGGAGAESAQAGAGQAEGGSSAQGGTAGQGESGQGGQSDAGIGGTVAACGAGGGSDNHSPAAPDIIEPKDDGDRVNGADVHMETRPMNDEDEGDEHVCSDFEIWTRNPLERVWVSSCVTGPEKVHTHLGDGEFENSHEGKNELDADTEFILRVRHRDSSGDCATEWSRWTERDFVTTPDYPSLPDTPDWAVMQPGFELEEIATGFSLPVNIAFVPEPTLEDGDPLFYLTELYGRIMVVTTDSQVSVYDDGVINYTPSGEFPGSGEQGLSGILVEPETGDLFVSLLWDEDGDPFDGIPRVVRYQSSADGLTAEDSTVILEMTDEQVGQSHFISNLTFGPDGMLYVHMGDGVDPATSLNLDYFRGKILRMNLDGSPAEDNPFYDEDDGINARDYVWAYGLRNPFGGDWRISDGLHFFVENGPDIDRFGVVEEAGESFGWSGEEEDMFINAIYNWDPACAPVNIEFIQPEVFGGSAFPADKFGHAFVSESGSTWEQGVTERGKRISEILLDEDNQIIGAPTALVQYNGQGRSTVAGLAAGPAGLYFTTLYDDEDNEDPTTPGASVFRVVYTGETHEQGLLGEYYGNADFSGEAFERIDKQVAFDWFARAPAPGLPSGTYSIRWTGEVEPEFSEEYSFFVETDSGLTRLSVDGTLLFDEEDDIGSIELEADTRYSIELEYYEEGAEDGLVILGWESDSQPNQVIPSDRLYPAE